MARDYIVESTYDAKTGVSTVVLQTKWGTFTNSVTCHPEDDDVKNRWDGCTFAHYKCIADKYAAKARAFQERANGIHHAADVLCEASKTAEVWHYHSDSIMTMRCLADVAERDAKRYREKSRKMRREYKDFCTTTLAAHRDFRKRAAAKTAANSAGKDIENNQKE